LTSMAKKRSVKFWIIFWIIAILLLAGWFFFWQIKNNGLKSLNGVIEHTPFVDEKTKQKYETLTHFADYALQNDNQEKNFLVLFQNNLELRPGGGYIGSFGILKVKNGKLIDIQTHDLSVFDNRIPNGVKPPYPLEETLKVHSWKLRDANFSPDFATNAQKAVEFYKMGQGQENFDGVIGVTSNVLSSLLKITGPIQIEGYPGTYDSSNAVISLEYQVEKAFEEQGIERQDRKGIMNELFKEIMNRVTGFNANQKLELFQSLMVNLNQKDIQLYFTDPNLENRAELANWDGKIDNNWKNDYLAAIDANVGAFKSDYYVKRSVDYTVDLSGDKPTADLKITYNHTAQKKDWMTNDYRTFLRVYVPDGSWLNSWSNNDNHTVFGNEFGKKYFGSIITVPIGQSKTIELKYDLPDSVKSEFYDLKIQKQSGLNDVPYSLHVINKNGIRKDYDFKLNGDFVLSESK
jgi:hypothetical protein